MRGLRRGAGLLGAARAPIAPSTVGPNQAPSAPTGEKLGAHGKGQAAMNCRGINCWMSCNGASPAPSGELGVCQCWLPQGLAPQAPAACWQEQAGLMARALQHKSDEERLREVGGLVWRKGDLEKRGDLISLYNLLEGDCDEVGGQTLFPSNKQ